MFVRKQCIQIISIVIFALFVLKSNGNTSDTQHQHRSGDLCAGDPKHGDPALKGGSSFMPSCATCISRVAINGGTCYENTWTFKTHCQCDSDTFESCHCWKGLNTVGWISYIVLPILTVLIIIILQICMRHSKCPIAKMEAELHRNLKKQAYLKKHGKHSRHRSRSRRGTKSKALSGKSSNVSK